MNDPVIIPRHSTTPLPAPPPAPTPTTVPQRMACELLTAVQLAELLNISERTLYRLKSRGSLPAPIQLGGSIRWRRTEILQWVADGCPPPSTLVSDSPEGFSMRGQGSNQKTQLCANIGAGELMSKIWRIETGADGPEYRYTVELVDAVQGVGTQLFEPADLPSLLNLLRVLTNELLHDGGFSLGDKVWLKQFADVVGECCDRFNSDVNRTAQTKELKCSL